MIPLGVDWTATASGKVIKFVQCEQCSHEYGYILTRNIDVSTFSVLGLDNKASAKRSQSEASRRLRKALKNSCDPVPCPECGWYQPGMIERARRIRLKWMRQVAIALVPLSILSPIVLLKVLGIGQEQYLICGVVMASMITICPLLILARFLLNKNYDPNHKHAEARMAIGIRLSLSKKDFEHAKARQQEV